MSAILRSLVFPAAAGLILAVACGGGAGNLPPEPSPDATITPEAVTEVTRERDGVRLTFSVDKERYRLDETVRVKAVVENTNEVAVAYSLRIGADQPMYIALSTDISGDQPLPAPEDAEPAQPGERSRTLEPGAELTQEVSWDQVIDAYQTPVQAPPGRYLVRAEFLIGEHGGGLELVALTAVVSFDLEGGEPVITPQEAITSAVNMPDVQSWLEPRERSLVCALNAQGLFYNVNVATGEVVETFDLFYQSHITNGFPICSPVTEDETWRVIFFGREGPDPSRISAFVDLHDGSPIRVEEGGPQGAPSSPVPSPVISPPAGN